MKVLWQSFNKAREWFILITTEMFVPLHPHYSHGNLRTHNAPGFQVKPGMTVFWMSLRICSHTWHLGAVRLWAKVKTERMKGTSGPI